MTKFFTFSTATLASLALLGMSTRADAQMFSKRKEYTSVGINLNAMNYFGDLNPMPNFYSFRLANTRPNIGIDIMHRFAPRISLRGSFAYGRITASDATSAKVDDANARFRAVRNASFYNDIYELSGQVVFDLIENRNNYLKRPDFVPYVFVGVAGFHHAPKTTDPRNGETVDLQSLRTEGVAYSKFQVSIPFGGGVRYRINRNFDASIEIGFRKTFTGYLDDVSGTYAKADQLTTDPNSPYFGGLQTPSPTPNVSNSITNYGITDNTGRPIGRNFTPGQQRGQGKDDWYVVTGVSLHYILRPKIKNPKFR